MRKILLSGLLAMSLTLTGCKGDPSKPEYWDNRISDAKNKKERVHAVEELRKSKNMGDAMLPVLAKHLGSDKSPEVKASIARMLGEVKATSTVDALIDAIDMGASDSDAKTMNKEIAVALGNIGDPKGVSALVKLLGTKDNYTIIAAMDALGTMKAKDGYDGLYRIAMDDTAEPFINKKAIMALGELGDARAVPGLVKRMFTERKGISFYMESSFALYQIGQPAADAVYPIVGNEDPELIKWAESNNIKPVALPLKASQVVGDFHDMRAEKALIGMLNAKVDFDDIKLLMRMKAADALGRLRSKEGAKAIAPLVLEEEPNARREYVWALSRIGSAEALPKLIESASKGSWDARAQSLRGIGMLGGEKELAALEKIQKDEKKLIEDECKANEVECKDVDAQVTKHGETYAKYKKLLEAARDTKDAAGWLKLLDSSEEQIRERAAYEIGRSQNAAVAGELMGKLREKNLDTRLAIIQAIDWLVHDSKEAAAKAKAALPELQKQLAEEKGKTEFVKVNEDLRRLAVKIDHSA